MFGFPVWSYAPKGGPIAPPVFMELSFNSGDPPDATDDVDVDGETWRVVLWEVDQAAMAAAEFNVDVGADTPDIEDPRLLVVMVGQGGLGNIAGGDNGGGGGGASGVVQCVVCPTTGTNVNIDTTSGEAQMTLEDLTAGVIAMRASTGGNAPDAPGAQTRAYNNAVGVAAGGVTIGSSGARSTLLLGGGGGGASGGIDVGGAGDTPAALSGSVAFDVETTGGAGGDNTGADGTGGGAGGGSNGNAGSASTNSLGGGTAGDGALGGTLRSMVVPIATVAAAEGYAVGLGRSGGGGGGSSTTGVTPGAGGDSGGGFGATDSTPATPGDSAVGLGAGGGGGAGGSGNPDGAFGAPGILAFAWRIA